MFDIQTDLILFIPLRTPKMSKFVDKMHLILICLLYLWNGWT